MSKHPLTKGIATLLMVVLLVPTVFLALPQRTQAAGGPGCVVGLATGLASIATNRGISVPTGDAPSGTASWTTAGSTVGSCIYNLVVVPVLRQMIRNFLAQMTQQTIDWINGNNSSGRPDYVPNLAINLQGVADAVSAPFINRIASELNSPFGQSVATALALGYAQGSSMAGFYAANQCTLPDYSPNVSSFLAGNWSQGGVGAWFALTTQNQNNPYTLYLSTQSQLESQINQAVTNRRQDLLQSGGILSFCKQNGTTAQNESVVSPTDPCTNADGSAGTIVTPGTVIQSYLNKNIGSGIGQLVSAQDLDSALGAVVAALANKVLGPNGLFSGSQFSSSVNTSSVPGLNTQSSGAASAQKLAQSILSNASAYTTAWQTISTSATSALTAVTALQNSCAPQASAAQTAISGEISPVITKAQAALSSVASSTALATKVQTEAQVTPIANPIQFSQDVTTLSTLPPSASDVTYAESQAQSTGGARANPTGSLTVSSGSLVDQMSLLSSNANALAASCNNNPIIGTNPAAP